MGIKDSLTSLFGRKDDKSDKNPDVKKPAGNPSGSFQTVREVDVKSDPLEQGREETRAGLTGTAFKARAEKARFGGETKTRTKRSLIYVGAVECDPFLATLPEDMRKMVANFIGEALYMAKSVTRIGTKDGFNTFFSTLKSDAPNRAVLNIFLSNMAGLMNGKNFYLKPNGDGIEDKKLGQCWKILRCYLDQPHPTVRAQKADLSETKNIPLVDVLSGLPLVADES